MPIDERGQLVVTSKSRHRLQHYPRGVKHGSMSKSAARENNNFTQVLSAIVRTLGRSSRRGGKKNKKRKTQKKRKTRKVRRN